MDIKIQDLNREQVNKIVITAQHQSREREGY